MLQYTDDTMLFLRRIIDLVTRFSSIFLFFLFIFGLRIDVHNINLFGVGMDQGEVQATVSSLGCQLG